ncbi:deoxyribose-phosphate aldolase [Bacillus swezeyi]|uniref:Deoxyribose-phosphate aldolase n=1 Tax=Bacillus swezeyi TaxID=1925020 RepID=A0A1R1RUD8_9BACI|nr:deoxyribose-phosphate aldolase [Bacillus swezeyi]MEC1261230.1 deoxyribose-phosphate aldolase [Bacillus swezeyi]MED2929299.1 deoxyribose-phosphate aldolase [Bacillus swezeyi]MED2941111.1 deoxyribose-phosphate aldolase [Bacillus swezeyi]MED2963674.1 deoxyribose-phosphate aldolase [Bacillus swezeyi]MED3073620.1 deoxyribose-phosphate aldolase [Bacillus swezeyi]
MKQIAQMIDHTALKPDTVKSQIEKLCKEAAEHEFASVCVNPYWVPLCAELLQGSDVKVCTVIGFPLGASAAATKAFETKQAMAYGADEIDMVMNIGALKDRDTGAVEKDIQAVTDAAEGKALVKVIIETALLTDEEKKLACELSVKAGADFVKTSTGFSGGGATAEDIRLMRETVGPNIGVKASGGIRDKESALAMIEAGATRIGASAGVSIISGLKADQGY